jgi:hypothetical protein
MVDVIRHVEETVDPDQEAGTPTNEEIAALHRYFIWSNRMRTHFDEVLQEHGTTGSPTSPAGVERFLYLSYWYGGLYVVVEGWRALKLSDPYVDRLLESPNVGLLRRYRNGAFHYQPSYFDGRFVDFFSQEGTAAWVRDLNSALGSFFLRESHRHRIDPQEQNGGIADEL